LHLHNAAAITMFAVRNGLTSGEQSTRSDLPPRQNISVG
jgi:hypothetical protein